MELIITKDEKELGITAAQIVTEYVNANPNGLLVFPTGNTPLGLYKNLVKRFQNGEVSFQAAHLVELDEYYGVGPHDHRNLFQWLKNAFTSKVNFDPKRIFFFDPKAQDIPQECARIEATIDRLGGIGLQVLGLGPNGHLGFNEPGTDFNTGTSLVQLSPESLKSNARYWGSIDQVPVQGLTLGLGTLSQAQETILLVSGKRKAEILEKMLHGPVSTVLPATRLRTMENVKVIADQNAAWLIA